MRISDWSSDVCSSDLVEAMRQCTIDAGHANPNLLRSDCDADELRLLYNPRKDVAVLRFATPIDFDALLQADDIGVEMLADFERRRHRAVLDRKSTRLNSSH